MRCPLLVSLTLTAVLAAPAVGPSAAYAAVETVSKSGPCRLQEAGAFDDAKLFKITLGKALRLTTRWRIDEFFGKRIINANVTVQNPSSKTMFFHYYVAFFDKDGHLLGCAGQGSLSDDGLAPGDETQLGSCLIPLPAEAFKAVASYKVILYESDTMVGK